MIQFQTLGKNMKNAQEQNHDFRRFRVSFLICGFLICGEGVYAVGAMCSCRNYFGVVRRNSPPPWRFVLLLMFPIAVRGLCFVMRVTVAPRSEGRTQWAEGPWQSKDSVGFPWISKVFRWFSLFLLAPGVLIVRPYGKIRTVQAPSSGE